MLAAKPEHAWALCSTTRVREKQSSAVGGRGSFAKLPGGMRFRPAEPQPTAEPAGFRRDQDNSGFGLSGRYSGTD